MGLFDVSLEIANGFYVWGWRASIAGAAITLFGVCFLMWGTSVRDRDFESHIADLHDRAATSEQQTKELEKGNINLQTNLERERIERLKLEATIAPRTMKPEHITAVTAAFRHFTGRRVSVKSYAMDAEGALLGQQIVRCLEDAGLIVTNGITTFVPIGALSLGVHVSAAEDRALAHGLASAIGENTSLVTQYDPQEPAGSAAMILGGDSGPPSEATILVGLKPIPAPR